MPLCHCATEFHADSKGIWARVSKYILSTKLFCSEVATTLQTKLKEILAARGIKIKWLEEQTGISHAAMSYLVNGRSEPTLRSARSIARVLGVTIEEIWPEEIDE